MAQKTVSIVLQGIVNAIKPSVVISVEDEQINLKEQVLAICHAQELLYELSLRPRTTEYLPQKKILEKGFATLFGLIAGSRDGIGKTLQLKHLASHGVVKKSLAAVFEQAMELQHLLYNTNLLQTDFSCFYKGFKVKKLPTTQLLPKEAYLDLVFLTYILKPECICKALENKLAILQFKNEQVQSKVQKFTHLNLPKIVRLQRIIIVYQYWEKILTEQLTKIEKDDLATALFIQQLLTYDKKALLNKLFQNQTLTAIINEVEQKLTTLADELPAKIYAYFVTEKQAAKIRVQQVEAKIRANQTYSQALIATAILGITRQPEYQLGQLAATINVHAFDQFPKVPIIGEQLSPQLLSKLCHAVGLSFLSITMYASSKFGYSYQLIAFFNRILLSQVDVLFKLGAYSERLNQAVCYPLLDAIQKRAPAEFTVITEKLKSALCFDELGVIEKSTFINWISGLGLQTMMTMGHNTMPAICGYIGGTAAAEITGTVVEKYAKMFDCDETVTVGLKVMAHFITYSYAYSYAYSFSAQWLAEAEQLLPQKQAYEIFGLGQYAKEQEVQQRYRELALQYHPDKCKVDCEGTHAKMLEINAAYNVLKKKYV